MKPVRKNQEPNLNEIILQEQLALKRIKELQRERHRRKRWWKERNKNRPKKRNDLWLIALALPAALFAAALKAPELERRIAPDERAQPRHEWEQPRLLPRLL